MTSMCQSTISVSIHKMSLCRSTINPPSMCRSTMCQSTINVSIHYVSIHNQCVDSQSLCRSTINPPSMCQSTIDVSIHNQCMNPQSMCQSTINVSIHNHCVDPQSMCQSTIKSKTIVLLLKYWPWLIIPSKHLFHCNSSMSVKQLICTLLSCYIYHYVCWYLKHIISSQIVISDRIGIYKISACIQSIVELEWCSIYIHWIFQKAWSFVYSIIFCDSKEKRRVIFCQRWNESGWKY